MIQIQAFVLLVSIHTLIVDMIKEHLNNHSVAFPLNFLQSKRTICKISDYQTNIPVILYTMQEWKYKEKNGS